ncbi:MAG: DUF4445 domain-containing protein, partial [Clostridiales bacterium]|nr:DUF4445 domain-containing protein [Clostridiales bacterium]
MIGLKQRGIKVLSNGEQRIVGCYDGDILMDIFHQNNIYIESPCGGNGICGKCKVQILEGSMSAVTDQESKFLSIDEQKDGYRLACMARIQGDATIMVKDLIVGAGIMSTASEYFVDNQPRFAKKYIELDTPAVDDQRDDLKRLADALALESPAISLSLLQRLPKILRESGFKVTISYDGDTILNVENGDTSKDVYGIAIDIGTTTVVCYLMDLVTGRQLDAASALNNQRIYGADVISRTRYAMENKDSLFKLKQEITSQIHHLIVDLANRNNMSLDNIYNIVIACNTVMGHLFMGINPEHIAASPFTPAVTQRVEYSAYDLGLDINKAARVFMLPHISGYVGSDVVAGILVSGMDSNDNLSLFIDIGTNGEIVLGSAGGMVCCSTAAGPAFEGANIRFGMGGVNGAINTVLLDGDRIKYTVIGDSAPMGICGSGIVDSLAVLLDAGLVDDTGRLLDEDEIESGVGQKLAHLLTEVDGQPAFILADAKSSGTGGNIVITQKDIREIQLAKAAIAAGVRILIKRMGKEAYDIENLYLAGGFGSYIDKRS